MSFAIPRLYMFDDLRYHVARFTEDWPEAERTSVRQEVGAELHSALGRLDWSRQDYTLFTWDGATAALAWQLADREAEFDLLVSQGCNGEYAASSLAAVYAEQHHRELSRARANVRITKFLTDPGNAFFSEYEIGVSRDAGLADQCRAALADNGLLSTGDRRLRVAVFDDCIQSGAGTRAVAEHLLALRPDAEISTLGLIACEATQTEFRGRGWRPIHGLLQPGAAYPATYDVDIYFTKDLILENAIRFSDGSSRAFVDDLDWIAKVFAGDVDQAIAALRRLQRALLRSGLYQQLLDL